MKVILTFLMIIIYLVVYTQIKASANHVLTINEAKDLNSIFEKKLKKKSDVNFQGKAVGYAVGASGTQPENKADFFSNHLNPAIDGIEKNSCALVIFTEEEKVKSGGFDVVIMSPAKIFTNKHREILIGEL